MNICKCKLHDCNDESILAEGPVLNKEAVPAISKSAPDYSFYHKVEAFFEGDGDIEVGDIDERTYEFTIYVFDKRKYNILKSAFHIPKYAKKIQVNFEYIDEDYLDEVTEKDLAYLLEGNKYFSRYVWKGEEGSFIGCSKYLLMKPEVVQYYDDIFNNPAGLDTKTAEAVAKEIFKGSHCNITTDIKCN